jgi:hypothetical protein
MSGYIGPQPVPQATQHRESFTATAAQTSFATAGYTPQFIDVYLNGVKLAGVDYTAANGSDIVLAAGATVGDILEYVAYTPFAIADQTFTGTTTTADLTVTGAFTSKGIDDNATATAITIDAGNNIFVGKTLGNVNEVGFEFTAANYIAATRDSNPPLFLNRKTTDGEIVQFRKDNIAVGKIDVSATGASIYLGGTGAANKLDDYEEGSWTPGISFNNASVGVTYSTQVARYVKVGRLVTVHGFLDPANFGSSTGAMRITGLPFASFNTGGLYAAASFRTSWITYNGMVTGFVIPNTALLEMQQSPSGATSASVLTNTAIAGTSASIIFSVTYTAA